MSLLQLQVLLQHVVSPDRHSVGFVFLGGRLFIRFTDNGGNLFRRSFGTDGSFVELSDDEKIFSF